MIKTIKPADVVISPKNINEGKENMGMKRASNSCILLPELKNNSHINDNKDVLKEINNKLKCAIGHNKCNSNEMKVKRKKNLSTEPRDTKLDSIDDGCKRLISIYGSKRYINQTQNRISDQKIELPIIKNQKALDISNTMNSIDEEELDLIDPDPFIVPREQRNSSMPRKISTSNTTKLMRGSGLFKYYNAKDPLSSLNTSEIGDSESKEIKFERISITRHTSNPLSSIVLEKKKTDIKNSDILSKIFSKDYSSDKNVKNDRNLIKSKKKRNVIDEITHAINRKAIKTKINFNSQNSIDFQRYMKLTEGIMTSSQNSKNSKSINEHGLVNVMVSKRRK